MAFRLKIDCSNAAFDESGAEVVRLLRELADRIERGGLSLDDYFLLMDINGNPAGSAVLEDD